MLSFQRAQCIAFVACLMAFVQLAHAFDDAPIKLDPAALKRWGTTQHVFVAKLESVVAGPVGQSFPPMYTHRLVLIVDESLRGGLGKGDRLDGSHVARQENEPTFPAGKTCLVTASATRGGLTIVSIEEATKENIAAAKLACSIPAGWSIKDGKLLSPWASLGKAAWPEPAKEGLRCSVTGRPVLAAGAGITFTVAPVPPVKDVQWANPDGDGEYRITIANPSEKMVEVPALLTDGKEILWAESLVIVCQDKTYMIPGSKGVTGAVKPVQLEPGKSVTTVVNALKLKGPEWPRGGYRIEFRFCLGEVSSPQSFYYLSKHHDPIREKLAAEKK